jgi:hypothetical protein
MCRDAEREHGMHNLNPIVAGVDFTPGSVPAIKEAIRLSKWSRG